LSTDFYPEMTESFFGDMDFHPAMTEGHFAGTLIVPSASAPFQSTNYTN